MSELLFPLPFIAVFAAIIYAAYVFQKRQIEAFRQKFQGDPEVEALAGFQFALKTRSPFREAQLVSAGGGKNNPARWEITTSAPVTSARTSLRLSREGVFGALREMIGVKDVQIGDAELDRAYTVRGSDETALRELLGRPEAKRAIQALFACDVWSFEVAKDGRVTCRAPRRSARGDDTKGLLLKMLGLVEALEGKAAVSPFGSQPLRASRPF